MVLTSIRHGGNRLCLSSPFFRDFSQQLEVGEDLAAQLEIVVGTIPLEFFGLCMDKYP